MMSSEEIAPSSELGRLHCLSLQGSSQALEACLGLFAPWVRGGRENPETDSSSGHKLELYIAAQDQTEVEAAWESWQAEALPAIQHVTRRWSQVPDRDWQLQWREHFTPLQVTENITIVPEWDQVSRAPVLVRICPGMAFGTGHHATTRLVIRRLESLGCQAQRILDLGTGSGILAIVAAKLGASHVVAVDNDPSCEENLLANLKLNGLGNQVEFMLGDASLWNDFNVDLVLANIHRSSIFALLEQFSRSDSGARVVVSGLLKEEGSLLRDLCRRLNLVLAQIDEEEDWFCALVSRLGDDHRSQGEIN
ncbi:MAG: 50S ribosomal protein L11 methyltransferase [Fidelibacterota bacterium]|nr:MAG: 50S ribosomal protein L11 methyltransferase [Candidatus Neomarinimicrobiota bacterium]